MVGGRRVFDGMHVFVSAAGLLPIMQTAGGLISYGANLDDLFRPAGIYLDKILKGTKPEELPVERPTKFEMVINLKTARGLGVTINRDILLVADDVID